MALGLRKRGAAFFLIVTLTFAVGLAVQGSLTRVDAAHPLTVLAAFTTWGTGVLKLVARLCRWGEGEIRSPTYEYGTTYLLTAGIMNLLLVLDVAGRSGGGRG